MPRTAREKSQTGIYHIILRGANKQEIFFDDEDRTRFLFTLLRFKREYNITIYAWCLMDNHIHLLIKEGDEAICTTLKRIGISFVWYYNHKYDCNGHLFQDRFKSEKVENERYFLTVLRYIHQNPVKASLVTNPQDWKWSSYEGYIKDGVMFSELLDSNYVFELYSNNMSQAVKLFIQFNLSENDDKCLDDCRTIKLKDEEALEEIKKLANGLTIAQIKNLSKNERAEVIKKAKTIKGVTQRQIARIFGVSQTLISIM